LKELGIKKILKLAIVFDGKEVMINVPVYNKHKKVIIIA
jgi:hypothetical protein